MVIFTLQMYGRDLVLNAVNNLPVMCKGMRKGGDQISMVLLEK